MEEIEKEEVMEGLKKHLEYVEQKFPQLNVLGIFVIGSQNYGLSLQTDEYRSNLDTVVVIQEDDSFEGCANEKIGNDNILILAQNHLADLLYNQIFYIMEILFTEYRIIKDSKLNILMQNADKIATASYLILNNVIKEAIYECKGMIGTETFPDEKVYKAFRLYALARDMFFGIPYRDALHPDSVDAKILLDIKTGKFADTAETTLQCFTKGIDKCARELLTTIEKNTDVHAIFLEAHDIINEFQKQFK